MKRVGTGHYAAVLLLSLLPGLSFGIVCTDVFSNAVGTTGGELKLDNQPRLVNTGNRVLATDNFSVGGKKANQICDNSSCSASGTPAESLALPPNNSGVSYDSSPLSFSAGDYFYRDFTLSGGQGTRLTVTSGLVRIHVSGKLVIDNARANFGGNLEDLVFLVAGDVDIKGKAKVKAIIYSEGKVVVTDNATQIEGAITGNSVEVKDKARITYDPDAVDATDLGGICTGGISPVIDAEGFNCVVTSGDALSGHLYLQKVGAYFNFDVVALKDSDSDGNMDAVETAFAAGTDRSLTVELVDASGGLSCASRPVLAPAVTQTLTFTAADAGRKATAPILVDRAYQAVACRVADATLSPSLVACSTDTFTIRPTLLALGMPTLNNPGPNSTPKAAAGSSFGLSAVGGAGYTGTPKTDGSKLIAHAGAVQTGVLAGSFTAAAAATGTATGSGFSYSEVGNFRFVPQGLYDDTFASGDEANGDCTSDFSNTLIGGKYGCWFGNNGNTDWIGRFHPDRFIVNTISPGVLSNTCGVGGFSYQGQGVPLSSGSVFRVAAKNSSGDTTQNYTGGYQKLNTNDFTFAAITGDGSQLGVDGINRVAATWSTVGSRNLNDNGDGTLDLVIFDAEFTWGRGGNDLVAPFTTDLDISLAAVVDDDNVVAIGLPATATPAGVDMRYGRVVLANTHGSELQHLGLPMQAQYYAGIGVGFVVNPLDTCSNVSLMTFSDLNASDGLATNETCIWDADDDSSLGCVGSGPTGMEYESSPNAGVFNVHLKAPGPGNSGVIGVTADVPSHLEYQWNGGSDMDPTSRATFGIFNRPSTIIFRREVR